MGFSGREEALNMLQERDVMCLKEEGSADSVCTPGKELYE